MKKSVVMAFGTFDLLHPGHLHYLREARKLGSRLVVVVARDSTVRRVKHFSPMQDQAARLAAVARSRFVDEAILGGSRDPFAVVRTVHPDVIALGYDQKHFIRGLPGKLQRAGIRARIVRIGAHRPDKFKSTILRARLKNQGRASRRTRVGSPTTARAVRRGSRRTP